MSSVLADEQTRGRPMKSTIIPRSRCCRAAGARAVYLSVSSPSVPRATGLSTRAANLLSSPDLLAHSSPATHVTGGFKVRPGSEGGASDRVS